MCGIAGFSGPLDSRDAIYDRVTHMCNTLRHRGPDGSGAWVDEKSGLALGHRRLAVLDLSGAGKQPMVSASGRFVLVFNGELYNHLELRKLLASFGSAPKWRGHSDTETLLASIETWGVEKTLSKLVGMFAFAVWDTSTHQLSLARDRMGEKPLYYGWVDGTLLFGSELKALKAHPCFNGEVDRNALALLLRHNCIPAPHCIYKNIAKLMPGHYLSISLGRKDETRSVMPVPYWSFNDAVENGRMHPFSGTAGEAVDLLEAELSRSIAEQMLADVPLGTFLSGGVDSSTVVALMQAVSAQPVRTFTIGSVRGENDEAVHAKAVAHHLGTKHTELYVRPEDALAVIPLLPSIYCEPFSDSSQIPTFLVSRMARQNVTVALSGDGGDELFGGYNRYLTARRVWGRMQAMPAFARPIAAGMLCSLSPTTWDRLYSAARSLLPKAFHLATPGEKAHKLAEVLNAPSEQAYFHQLASHWKQPSDVVIGAREPQTLLTDPAVWPKTDSFEHWMMVMDARTYMADDILVKVDRAAMANSLETRVPMLDHRVVELAWRMPLDFKIRNGQGKWLLREVLYRHVPRELIERPKMGFGIPLDDWLRGPLRQWAESLLDATRLRREGYFHPAPIRKLWAEHLSYRYNRQYHLWDVLMFQAWLEAQ